MIQSRNQPGVAFWATVVVVAALVQYPLSIGPVTWLDDHGMIPDLAHLPLNRFYRPLDVAALTAPKPIPDALFWYTDLWGERLWGVDL